MRRREGKPSCVRMYNEAMAGRVVVNSVERVAGPPAGAAGAEARAAALRGRFPGAVVERYLDRAPTVGERVRIAAGAAVIGDVVLADDVSVWYGCVLRGDVNRVEIRERSNVQDGSVVHLGDLDGTFVAEEVVIGHRAVIHGCRIGGGTLVGIQATILDGATVGEGSIVGAGALVTAGTTIPPHSLVLGAPAKVVRTLTAADEANHRALALKYVRLAHNYRVG
jgi:carbonic anhydrase/acetyltransferase-like protein (isoleucine patch superfamily)